MKIFRDGAIPMPPPRWPFCHGFECFHCHCQFEVEEGDDFEIESSVRIDGDTVMHCRCPCCTAGMKATRPKTSPALRFAPSTATS